MSPLKILWDFSVVCLNSPYIKRTGKLPPVPIQKRPVRRSKPHYHWCSYEKWGDPLTTRENLQILADWSDCQIRATISTKTIRKSAYVAFNGDKHDPENDRLHFYKYFYEPLAQDHPPQLGGGTQIGVDGSLPVLTLERWDEINLKWVVVWNRS